MGIYPYLCLIFAGSVWSVRQVGQVNSCQQPPILDIDIMQECYSNTTQLVFQ